MFSCLVSKLIYLVCHLPWLKVIFHHYEVIFQCIKCLILILGTCQATFGSMSRMKTYLFSLSSLSYSMAKGHLPSLWGHLQIFLCVNCLILGTWEETFVFMSRFKTHLFNLSSSRAKSHLPWLWSHLPMCQVLNIDDWSLGHAKYKCQSSCHRRGCSGWSKKSKKRIAHFTYIQWFTSLDKKTKVARHVPKIKFIILKFWNSRKKTVLNFEPTYQNESGSECL